MEVKLGMYAYYTISMTMTCFHDDCILFEKASGIFPSTTSSLLKLANSTTHGGETWYACVLHCFHDNHNNKWPQTIFFETTSSLLKLANDSTHGNETWYIHMRIISMTTTGIFLYFFNRGLPAFTQIFVVVYKNEWRQVN